MKKNHMKGTVLSISFGTGETAGSQGVEQREGRGGGEFTISLEDVRAVRATNENGFTNVLI